MKNINIGINGFGRIGKCIFLQLLEDNAVNINAININNLSINDIEEYINNDSIHHIKKYKVEILENNYNVLDKTAIKKYNKLLFKKGISMQFRTKEDILKAKIVSVDKNGALKLNVEGKGFKKFEADKVKYML